MKCVGGYLRLKLRVRVNGDYMDTRLSKLVIDYFCENEKVRETIYTCLYGDSRDTVPNKLYSICIKLRLGAFFRNFYAALAYSVIFSLPISVFL